MKLLGLLLVLVLVAGCERVSPIPPADGQAAVDTVTWTLPTAFENGSALTVGPGPRQLKEVLIQWGTANGGPYAGGSLRVAAPGTSATFQRPAPGYGLRCYIVFSVLNDGTLSNASNEACKEVDAPPKSPTNLQVN